MLQINKNAAWIFVFGLLLVLAQPVSGGEKISRIGEYAGYSKEQYDGWQRSSQYVTVRDGTRIRVTITGADANTFETPVVNPVPEITLYRSEMRPSRIVLPIIK